MKKSSCIKVIGWIVLLSLSCIGFCYLFIQTRPPSNFEWPQETVDYTYVLPTSATVIEGKADVADIFGDHSKCIAFTLPESELEVLRQKGLNWFSGKYPVEGEPQWRVGALTTEERNFVSHMLVNKPAADAVYSYLGQSVDGGVIRAVAINEESKIIYYCSVSW